MSTKTKNTMKEVMLLAWQFVRKNGYTIREAWGTLNENMMPATTGTDKRTKNDTVQVYYDTEKQSWRSYKRANLISIA